MELKRLHVEIIMASLLLRYEIPFAMKMYRDLGL